MDSKRIGILVVAYNAAGTLAWVLDRIPADFRGRIAKVLIGDDASQDSTHLVGPGLRATGDGLAHRGDNRILTTVQNVVVGTSLSEWHS